MDKHRLIKTLEKMQLDELMTVGELMSQLRNKIESDKQRRIQDDESTINKFKGAYLKRLDKTGMFGKELEIIHIEDLHPETYNTDWDRLFELKGTIVSFSSLRPNSRRFKKGDSYSLYSDKTLNSFIVITKEEFLTYKKKAEDFNTELNNIING